MTHRTSKSEAAKLATTGTPKATAKSAPSVGLSGLRSRAEKSLRRGNQVAASKRNADHAAPMTHELEVQKIELEMQNAELLEARTQVEAALATYAELYEVAPIGYFSVDDEGTVLDVNLTGAAMLGTERSRIVGARFDRFVDPASRATVAAFMESVFLQSESPGKSESRASSTCEVSLRTSDGREFWTSFRAGSSPSVKGTRAWCRLAVTDISASRRADQAQLRADALATANRELTAEVAQRREVETALRASEQRHKRLLARARIVQVQLRDLSRGVLGAQEEERKRISRELHDVFGQSIVGINLHLGTMLLGKAGASPRRAKQVAKATLLLGELADTVHRFSRELRPPTLDDLGLIPALRAYAREFSERTGVDVRLTSDTAADRFPEAERTVLYRVAQEALTNVAKHAHATRVDITLAEVAGALRMEVADNGGAFRVAHVLAARKRRSLGLLGMRERMAMVGGTVAIELRHGKGTCVRAQIPLARVRGDAGTARKKPRGKARRRPK